jgi:hypothetical protein
MSSAAPGAALEGRMKLMQKIIYAGFATCALASASMPALSWAAYPDTPQVDFSWYANVGEPLAGASSVEVFPAPREGYIWAPGRYERTSGGAQQWVPGHWIADDYAQQVVAIRTLNGVTYATGPLVLYDSQGNAIPTNPDAYPLDSPRR